MVGGHVILGRGRLGYVSYAKNVLGLEFWAILSLTPPPVSALGCNHNVFWVYRGFQKQMLGGPRSARGSTILNARGRLGGARKRAKTRILAGFLVAEGQASDYGGRLCSDCGADSWLPRVAHGHRAWFTPLGPASIKQLKTRIPEPFSHRKGQREMRGKAPLCRRSLSTEMASGGGGKGGEGGQNRPKLELWRVFGTGYLCKSSRIQDGRAHRDYF